MNWSTSVVAAQSSDTEPTIFITFETAKYSFNMGENASRSLVQSRRGWKKVRGLFLTQVGTQRTSGLPGFIMSVADATARKLDVVGPSGILHLLASMRLYTFRNSLCVNVSEIQPTPGITQPNPTPAFSDENITVYSIPLIPGTNSNSDFTSVAADTAVSEASSSLKRKRTPSPDAPSKRSPTSRPNQDSKTVLERLRDDANFSPSSLVGAEAQEWRRLVLDHMFTWTEPPPQRHLNARTPKKVRGPQSPVSDSASSSLPQKPHWAEEVKTEDTTKASSTARRGKGVFNPAGSYYQLPKYTDSAPGSSLAYVVVGPRVRGRFDAKRAQELGLQGRLRGRVARGETVTYTVDDGKGGQVERTVRPEDCVGESESPVVVMILDVPSQAHIPDLTSSFDSPFYSTLRSKDAEDLKKYNVHIIYHLLGEGVLEDPRYIEFMNGFPDHTHHLISSREHNNDPVTFTSCAFNQLRLNCLDPDMFPLIKYDLKYKKDLSSVPSLPANAAVMQIHTFVDMRPPSKPVLESFFVERDSFHPAVATPRPISLPASTRDKFTRAKSAVQAGLAIRNSEAPSPGDDLVVIPLGTSSTVTTRYRNVSGILLKVPERGYVLFDAGEGTFGQLMRTFGSDATQPENAWQVLRELKCIFISHAHADHHVGLAKILAMRKKLDPPPEDPLYLVSVRAVHLYLREQADLEDLGLADSPATTNGVVTVMSDVINYRGRPSPFPGPKDGWQDPLHSRLAAEMCCDALGLHSLETVDVKHRTRAYGAIMTSREGWRVVYSGDTMPCSSLVEAGDGATLLIHEATMGDDQEAMAHHKAHSTVSQAVGVGRQMNAKNVLLTHFSTRYPHMPAYLSRPGSPARGRKSSSGEGPVVALALDHARVRVGDMWKLRAYLRAIEQSFHDTFEEGDEEEEQQALMASAEQVELE